MYFCWPTTSDGRQDEPISDRSASSHCSKTAQQTSSLLSTEPGCNRKHENSSSYNKPEWKKYNRNLQFACTMCIISPWTLKQSRLEYMDNLRPVSYLCTFFMYTVTQKHPHLSSADERWGCFWVFELNSCYCRQQLLSTIYRPSCSAVSTS